MASAARSAASAIQRHRYGAGAPAKAGVPGGAGVVAVASVPVARDMRSPPGIRVVAGR